MKIHTTNYENTLIAIATDSKAVKGEIPPLKNDKKTIANLQFDLISKNPYQFTSDEVLFKVFADRNDLLATEYSAERTKFFSKGQACLRTSPLTKKYGWGIHHDNNGKVALFGVESKQYQQFLTNKSIVVVNAMRSSKS